MATFRLPILGWNMVPDSSGNVWIEPFSIAATNDVWARHIIRFKDTATRVGLHGGFTVPKNYVGSAAFKVVWTATATTGDVVWDLDYRTVGGDDTTSLDQAGTEEAITVTDTAPGAALRRLEASLSPTAGNFAADEEVEFTLFRDGVAAGDTMAADALLFALLFEYADA